MPNLPPRCPDLNRATADPVGVHPVETKPCSIKQRRNVLVAEDSLTNFDVLNEYLVDAEYVVHHAVDGRTAVELADAVVFDVILMDISMPEVNGFEASLKIRQGNGPNRTTPIVALTAHALEARDIKFKDAGMTGYISKPFRRNRLLAILQDIRHGSVKADAVALHVPRSKIIAIFTADLTSK